MSFPSATGSSKGLAITYSRAKQLAGAVKQRALGIQSLIAGNTLGRFETLKYMTNTTDAITEFAVYSAVPGIVQYAKDQEDNQTLDIAVEFTAMISALTSVRDWLVTNYPVDGSGFTQTFTIVSGKYADAGLPAGALTAFDALLTTLVTAID